MRIVIGDKSYGSAQLTCAMAEMGDELYPAELHSRGPQHWQARVDGLDGDVCRGPWLALCDAAKRAGYDVEPGR